MPHTDTILALSSSPDPAGTRALLRLSGRHAHTLTSLISSLPTNAPPGHHPITLNDPHLPAAALLFHAPRSFTGEHTAELHLPNSPALLRHLTDQLLTAARTHHLPARPANPGEFSARAFFNNKIDLTQAEGIAATINAQNQTQLRAAASLRTGHLHAWIHTLAENVASLLALLEAGIDFVDEEDIRFLQTDHLIASLDALTEDLSTHLARALRLDRLDALPTVVFTGPPNVGKSSLINALTRSDRSIVSPVAGTTRDALAATLHSPQGDIRLLDLPGNEAPTDTLRTQMMSARDTALLDADLIIHVSSHDVAASDTPQLRTHAALLVQNKIDTDPAYSHSSPGPAIPVSAHTGKGIDTLRTTILTRIHHKESTPTARLALNHRHRTLLHDTAAALHTALSLARSPAAASHPELLAADLRSALDLLGQITGTISPDDILGKIFSTFCIGK